MTVRASLTIKVPSERLGALIGPDGVVKGKIGERFGVELDINSETGDVTVSLRTDAPDPTMIFRARDVITAIGRGFAPGRAFRLLNDDVSLEVIDLREYFGRSQADIQRVKGRVIGKGGKTRGLIEELTGADVSVYGHTISIIGGLGQLEVAREAVEMLVKGREHKSVYNFLHLRRRVLKEEEMEIWESPQPEPRERVKTRTK